MSTPPDEIIGRLASRSEFDIAITQTAAWQEENAILRPAVAGLPGFVLLEFSIPRMGRRIDAVLLLLRSALVIEFKVGSQTFDRSGREQVWDYALDLKNFHEASHSACIIPVLVATAAKDSRPRFAPDFDGVFRPIESHANGPPGHSRMSRAE